MISASWPKPIPTWEDNQIESDFDLIKDVTRSIREIRSRYHLSPTQKIDARIKAKNTAADILLRLQHLILHMGRLGSLEVSSDIQRPAASTIQVLGDLELYLTGVIDPAKERERLKNKQKKLQKEAEKAEARLKNENFLKRAPTDVVETERQKLNEIKTQMDLIQQNLESLEGS